MESMARNVSVNHSFSIEREREREREKERERKKEREREREMDSTCLRLQEQGIGCHSITARNGKKWLVVKYGT